MSASAPLGSPSRKTGSADAVCTSAISVGEVVSDVISQAAATSFIHIETFEAAHTSHNIRKVRSRRGAHAVPPSCLGGAAVPGSSPLMPVQFLECERLAPDAPAHVPRLSVPPPHLHHVLLVAQLGDRP